MAIVNMSKFNLMFFNDERDSLLRALQHFKYVHFDELKEDEIVEEFQLKEVTAEENIDDISEEIQKATFVIEQLHPFDRRAKGFKQLKEGMRSFDLQTLDHKAQSIDLETIYNEVGTITQEKERIERQVRHVNEEINELKAWIELDYPLKKLSNLKETNVRFGTISKKIFEQFKLKINNCELTYYNTINQDHNEVYLLVISHVSEQNEVNQILINHNFNQAKLAYKETPKAELTVKENELKNYEDNITELDKKLSNFAAQLEEIEIVYDYLSMKKTRFTAAEELVKTDRLHIMQGYVPTAYTESFKHVIEEQLDEQFYLQIVEADEEDPNIPILLENAQFASAFESVTKMYALPKYNEIDPTPWFSIFYAIFFGMMIGDAGYGLLILFLSFGIMKVINLTEKQRNFFQFFHYLSFTTIIWGLIFGSFFGDLFTLPAIIDTNEQYNLLLILSIALGAVHVFFALGIQAYIEIKRKNFIDAFFDVGLWYMLLIGSIVFLLSYFVSAVAPYQKIGFVLMIIGMIGIVLTGGRDQKSLGGKFAGGLYSLYGLTSYISDFVSYSRLMALALASGFIAYAINLMVFMLFELGVIGIVFGIFVFIIGQGFNIFLSILSSYVHTLRLTYVEFFGKFYEGGGKPFQIFRNTTKYINVK